MRIYIAGHWPARSRLRTVAEQMQTEGHEVTSTWLWVDEATERENAVRDLADISRADYFVIDTQDESKTGGREVELGYAYAKGKGVFRIGPPRNIFHSLLGKFEGWSHFREVMSGV